MDSQRKGERGRRWACHAASAALVLLSSSTSGAWADHTPTATPPALAPGQTVVPQSYACHERTTAATDTEPALTYSTCDVVEWFSNPAPAPHPTSVAVTADAPLEVREVAVPADLPPSQSVALVAEQWERLEYVMAVLLFFGASAGVIGWRRSRG